MTTARMTEADLTPAQQLALRNVVASSEFEGHIVTDAERAELVRIVAGEITADQSIAELIATIPTVR
jgi:hypothetical protein